MKSIALIFLILFAITANAQITYVTLNGTGIKDGSSWENSIDGNAIADSGYTKLAYLIRTASSGSQFWIAEGVYKICTDNDREKSILLGEDIKLYGGFVGTETDTNQRVIESHPTIFSGDIGVLGTNTDNSKIILKTSSSWVKNSVINGIDFIASYNASSGIISCGLYNTGLLYVKNCSFKDCYSSSNGGGINNSGTLYIEKSIAYNNRAAVGAGIYNAATCNATIISTKVTNNTCYPNDGAGIGNYGIMNLINSVVANNSANYNTGGILSWVSSKLNVYNSTIVNNKGKNIYCFGGTVKIYNSILWGGSLDAYNADVKNSIVQGYTGGQNVLNVNPLFVNGTPIYGTIYNGITADWRLRWCSPALNMGLNSLVPVGINTDLNGESRIRYTSVDMGACELDSTGIIPSYVSQIPQKVYVLESNVFLGNGTSWNDALAGNYESCKYPGYSLLAEVMKDAPEGTEFWIQKGTYNTAINNDRSISFVVKSGYRVYGGFEGVESDISERGSGKTLFSGNIGSSSDSTDNAYHIVYVNSAGITFADTALIDNINISSGYADGTGTYDNQGAGLIIGSGSKLKIINGIISRNISKGNGAGINIQPSASVYIDSSSIVNNGQIIYYINPNSPQSASGGGFFSQGKLSLQNCEISNNLNSTGGSGIYSTDSLFIVNCIIDSNKTKSVYSRGGGIVSTKYCFMKNSKVRFNDAYLGNAGISNGTNSFMFIDSSDILYNVVIDKGNGIAGGIKNDGNLIVINSNIKNNTAPLDGGGIYNSLNCSCSISNCNISENISSGGWSSSGGGGIYNKGTMQVVNSTFYKNMTSWYGGGINNIGTMQLDKCEFNNNTANYGGGAAYNPTIVKNCIVANNSTGLLLGIGFQGVFSSTIVNNSGAGISISGDTCFVRNCIVYGNNTQLAGTIDVSNSCVQGCNINNHNIYDIPLFVNPTLGKGVTFDASNADWSLQSCSPCVNMGDSSFLSVVDSVDIADSNRVFGSQVDMGAYELQATNADIIDYRMPIIYINDSSVLSGNGASWTTSFAGNAPSCRYVGYTMLYQILREASANSQIWMKKGTYKVATDGDRNKFFLISSKNKLYGGFNGTENSLSQRLVDSVYTVFSGNIGSLTDSLDNTITMIVADSLLNGLSDTAIIDRIQFRDVYSSTTGSALKILAKTNVKITDAEFQNNSCRESSALLNSGNLSLSNCEISNNQGISILCNLSTGNISVKDSKIIYNKTVSGGIYHGEGVGFTNRGSAIIKNVIIKYHTMPTNFGYNYASGLTGGMGNFGTALVDSSVISHNYIGLSSSGKLVIKNCSLDTNNISALSSSGEIDVNNCSFVSNDYATFGTSGICNLKNSYFYLNYGRSRGGAVNNSGLLNVEKCVFDCNSTGSMPNVGNIFTVVVISYGWSGGAIYNSGTCNVDNSFFIGNKAISGGAISNAGGKLIVKNSEFTRNFSILYGAVLYNNKKAIMRNCLIANNSSAVSSTHPNAIIGVGEGSNTSIVNSNIVNNNTTQYNIIETGRNINNRDVINQLIDTVTISNSIFWNNNTSIGNPNNSLIQINNTCITGGWAGVGNINANPQFVNPTAGMGSGYNALFADWTLSACSPCINAGVDSLCLDSVDLSGNPRKYHTIDMGAYELNYNNSVAETKHQKTGRTFTTLRWENTIKPCQTLVFIKDTSAGSPNINIDSVYISDTVYGNGSNVEDWYCIYQGNDTLVSITGLLEGTTYRVAIFNRILDSIYDAPSLMNFNTEKTTLSDVIKIYGDSAFVPQATSYSGIIDYNFSIDYDSIAYINNDSIYIVNTGVAQISVKHSGNEYYLPDSTQAVLTINKAVLNAIADKKVKIYGESNPPLTITYHGFKGNDNAVDIDSLPIATTTALDSSNVGIYPITLSGGFDRNYSINKTDSLLVINKYIHQIVSNNDLCNGSSLEVGNSLYTETGNYCDTIQYVNIDTVVFTNLNVLMVDISVMVNGFELESNATNATYQWIDCANNQPISGEVAKQYTATQNGSYAVIISQGACVDTSECIQISTVNTTSLQVSVLKIYPNPAKDELFILGAVEANIRILDALGKLVFEAENINKVNISGLQNGLYQVVVMKDGVTSNYRLVKD